MKRISFSEAFAGLLVGSFAGWLYLGCGSPDKLGGSGTGTGSGSGGVGGVTFTLTTTDGGASGTSGDGGTSGASGTTGSAEGICGDTTITPNRAPTDVLIVLDRSESMGWSMGEDCYCTQAQATATGLGSACRNPPSDCSERWSVVSGAVNQTVAANPSLNWGIELFSGPNSPSCSVATTPQVVIGPNKGPEIQSLLENMTLQLWTPTALAVTMATNYLLGLNDGNDKVILLATDGEPNCKGGRQSADEDMVATSAAVAAAASLGFPVYVIGIGPTEAIANLDELAQVGGTSHYYAVDSAQELADALAAITRIVATTCEFQTPQSPPDDSKVWVYVDKQLIEQSVDEGWTFGATSSDIVLTGSYCAAIMGGAPSTVQIVFGCKDYVPPPIIP